MTETTRKILLIRADASSKIGTGHLMRCLALAQAWKDAGGRTVFLMATKVPALEHRLHPEGMEVVHLPVQPGSIDDAAQTANFAQEVGADWVVVDGYHFGADYQRTIKERGLRLLFIDDNGHAEHYYADIVLNQNIHAHEGLYRNREVYTRLLVGTRYVLLRREFLKWRDWKRKIPDVARKVLVTMGGSDSDNVTLNVIRALQQVNVDGLEAIVVVGGGNPHYEELQSAVQSSHYPIRLESNVTDMPELMAWADVAVSGSGTTCWELAFMGVPSIVVILTKNQKQVAEGLHKAGAVLDLGWYKNLSCADIANAVRHLLPDRKIRSEMAQRGRQLVDGDGVARVLMHLRGERLRLRAAREEDCGLLWEWANDPEVRSVSFSSDPIPWEHHVQWFKSRLASAHCQILIAIDGNESPVGQARFDINGKEAIISIGVDRKFRSKGLGTEMIRLAVQQLFNGSDVDVVHAHIKPDNEASIKAFKKAGFEFLSKIDVKGHKALHFILRRCGGDENE